MDASNVIRAFTADQVVKLTGLSKRQLSYWDETGFFSPHFGDDRQSPYNRVYSFKDVLGLRTLAVLRKVHGIPLQQLRRVAERLSKTLKDPWSDVVLYVLGREVHFKELDTRKIRGVLSGQYVNIALLEIANDLQAQSDKLRQRGQRDIGRIRRNRYVVHNAWVVAGTRIPTKTIWRYISAGYSPEYIRSEYPDLTDKDIKAAVRHERKLARAS